MMEKNSEEWPDCRGRRVRLKSLKELDWKHGMMVTE